MGTSLDISTAASLMTNSRKRTRDDSVDGSPPRKRQNPFDWEVPPSGPAVAAFDSATDNPPDQGESLDDYTSFINATVDVLLEIAPSADVDILVRLVHEHLAAHGPDQVIESVIEQAYEYGSSNDDTREFDGDTKGFDEGAVESSEGAMERSGDSTERGDGLETSLKECGCCMEDVNAAELVDCLAGHSFCSLCVCRYASNQISLRKVVVVCMHISGCKANFLQSDLRLVLPAKLFDLYERLAQREVLKAAKLQGLEECPFCDWACIVETSKEEDPLFVCNNGDNGCGVQSCRRCKNKYRPRRECCLGENGTDTIDEHARRLAIEEAMTAALTRRCLQCTNGPFSVNIVHTSSDTGPVFIKRDGVRFPSTTSFCMIHSLSYRQCNKMTCPVCGTMSCYVCKREIPEGYAHFERSVSQSRRSIILPSGSSCRHFSPLPRFRHVPYGMM